MASDIIVTNSNGDELEVSDEGKTLGIYVEIDSREGTQRAWFTLNRSKMVELRNMLNEVLSTPTVTE